MLKTHTLDGWRLSLEDWIMRESDGDGVPGMSNDQQEGGA